MTRCKKTTQMPESDFVEVPKESFSLEKFVDWFSSLFKWCDKSCHSVYMITCPHCHGESLKRAERPGNFFVCSSCKNEYEAKLIPVSPNASRTKAQGQNQDVALMICDPGQDWSSELGSEGEKLSYILGKLKEEREVWYAIAPFGFNIPPDLINNNGITQDQDLLIILSGIVDNDNVFQKKKLSQLAISRVLEENEYRTVIREIARISGHVTEKTNLNFKKP